MLPLMHQFNSLLSYGDRNIGSNTKPIKPLNALIINETYTERDKALSGLATHIRDYHCFWQLKFYDKGLLIISPDDKLHCKVYSGYPSVYDFVMGHEFVFISWAGLDWTQQKHAQLTAVLRSPAGAELCLNTHQVCAPSET